MVTAAVLKGWQRHSNSLLGAGRSGCMRLKHIQEHTQACTQKVKGVHSIHLSSEPFLTVHIYEYCVKANL